MSATMDVETEAGAADGMHGAGSDEMQNAMPRTEGQSFDSLERLQEFGVSGSDVKKLKEAGTCSHVAIRVSAKGAFPICDPNIGLCDRARAL